MDGRRFSPRSLAVILLVSACARSRSPADNETAQTVAWNAPGFSAAEPGSKARFVLRDGTVSVWAAESGLALVLPGGGPALRWTLAGAQEVEPRGDGPLPGRVHRRVGAPSMWQTGLPTYGRLIFDGVYPGVRLTVESRRHAVAYRFDVAPGGDPGAIRMRYAGADGASVEKGGRSLRVHAGGRALREDGLFCYQEISGSRREVPCRYRIAAGTDAAYEVALDIGAYHRDRRLVVDPTIAWSSYLGGDGDDFGYGIAVDGSGNVYVAGSTASSDFPSAGGFDASLDGAIDAFVAKVDATGSSLVWSSYLGGSDSDEGYGVAVDGSDNVYLTGYTASTDFPTTGGFDTTFGGAPFDAFVAQVDAAGSSLLWSSYLGGSDSDIGQGVAVDGSGVYVAGSTASSDFPSGGGFDASLDGTMDAFVAKVDVAGTSLLWSSYLGGTDSDVGDAVAVDSLGNVYVVGSTSSSDLPTSGGFDASYGGSEDAFVAKVDAAGTSLAWSSYLGGSDLDEGYAVAVDGGGNVYVTGFTVSPDFPSSGGFDTTFDPSGDAFVAKVDAVGTSLAWSSYLGGSDFDEGYGIAVDGVGDVYVTGDTFSLDFPSSGGFDTTPDAAGEAFVTRVDAAGSILTWSSYLGGSDSENGTGIVVAPGGSIYVTGYTFSSDFPSSGGFDTSLGGSADAFVTLISDLCGNAACDVDETPCTCPADCGDFCGDCCCTGAEDPVTCSMDCPGLCGDGVCNAPCEDLVNCAADCSVCGDGNCTGPEDTCSCAADCGDNCGDGCCTVGEAPCTCPGDCIINICGDGCCTVAEDSCSCVLDCPGTCCGDASCDPGETRCGCPTDCIADVCGDLGCCGPTEDACGCPADCGADTCGNGCCGPAEDTCACATDCGDACGDCCCTGAEDGVTCSTDCAGPCGDGLCNAPCEDLGNCPADCSVCGDASCTGPEDACNCVLDCV